MRNTKYIQLISGLLLLVVLTLMVWSDSNLWEDEGYAVYVIDGQTHFGIKIDDAGTFHGRVESEIIAVGSNEKFVVIARKINESVLYFYIEKSKDNKYLDSNEVIEAGYSLEVFNELKKQHSFPEFSVYF